MTGEVLVELIGQDKILKALSQTGDVVFKIANEKELLAALTKTPLSTWIAFLAVFSTFFGMWISGKQLREERMHQFKKEQYFFKVKKAEELIKLIKTRNDYDDKLCYFDDFTIGAEKEKVLLQEEKSSLEEQINYYVAFHFPHISLDLKTYFQSNRSMNDQSGLIVRESIEDSEIFKKIREAPKKEIDSF